MVEEAANETVERRPVAVVFNPSKVNDAPGFRRRIEAEFARAGWPPPRWWDTTVDDPGRGQARQAVEDGAEVLLACGGDGTVNACIHQVVGRPVALAVLPLGTGNLLAMNLGLPAGIAAAVAIATGAGRRQLDVGDADGRSFAVMAGMGFDARLMASTSPALKARLGWAAYVIVAFRHLRDPRMRVQIRLDDREPFTRKARAVLVANVGRLQGGIELLPEARLDSGHLEVAVLNPRTLGHWLRLVFEVVLRRPRPARMQAFGCQRVELHCDREEPRELDGDLITPSRTMTVTIQPGALMMCVPADKSDQDPASAAKSTLVDR
jgi:diacylglycerol kinase family enzyme